MAYQITLFPMTLSDFKGRLPIASSFKCNFLYGYAAVDKISTDTACCTVRL